ncbi:hypothetical protein M5E87_21365 [Flavonifractor plautii]|nr:hypothetical protein M5E87_21365 [Flavonifractor plautii]
MQEAAEGQLSAQKEAVTSGSSIAGGREQKQMAFTTLLGSEEEAAAFLADVQDMAAMTNYTYDEITGYAKSLVKPFGADKSLDILTTLSDASAALFLNESDNAVLIAGLSRMKLTDKTTQEYLNYFSERGIDVYEALSKWGDAAAVAEKVTRGEIRGSEAVEEILAYMQEQYGGLSEQMAGTYEGMVDNLADAEANAEAAYGEGYNEKRKEGIQAQMDWLNSGAMDEANRAIGAWQAELENAKEQYQREAVEAMMETDEYQQAQAEGDAAEMGRLIMQAKVQGMNEYNASEGLNWRWSRSWPWRPPSGTMPDPIRRTGTPDTARARSTARAWRRGWRGVRRAEKLWRCRWRTAWGMTAFWEAARRPPARRRAGAGALRRVRRPAPRGGAGAHRPGGPAGRPGRRGAGDYHRKYLRGAPGERHRRHCGGALPEAPAGTDGRGAVVLRLITFLEEAVSVELVLPVTPSSYQWPHEAAIETVTVDQLGISTSLAGKGWGAPPCTTASCPPRRTRFCRRGRAPTPGSTWSSWSGGWTGGRWCGGW